MYKKRGASSIHSLDFSQSCSFDNHSYTPPNMESTRRVTREELTQDAVIMFDERGRMFSCQRDDVEEASRLFTRVSDDHLHHGSGLEFCSNERHRLCLEFDVMGCHRIPEKRCEDAIFNAFIEDCVTLVLKTILFPALDSFTMVVFLRQSLQPPYVGVVFLLPELSVGRADYLRLCDRLRHLVGMSRGETEFRLRRSAISCAPATGVLYHELVYGFDGRGTNYKLRLSRKDLDEQAARVNTWCQFTNQMCFFTRILLLPAQQLRKRVLRWMRPDASQDPTVLRLEVHPESFAVTLVNEMTALLVDT